jgi:hypothetical protein
MNKTNGVDWYAVFQELKESILALERIASKHDEQLDKILGGISQLSAIARSHEDRITRLEEDRGGKAQ